MKKPNGYIRLKELALLAIGFSAATGCKSHGTDQEKGNTEDPNILFVMVDDMGYSDIGVYGQDAYDTPNLDEMAAQGMRFTQAYSGSSVSAPARSTLMTGLHMGHTQVRGNTGGIPLPDEATTIAETLQKDGYAVGGFGKWGLGDLNTEGVPEKQGFNTFYGYYHQIHAHYYYPEYLIHTGEKVYLPNNSNYYEDHENQQGGIAVQEGGKDLKHSHYLIFNKMKQWIRDHQDEIFFCYAPLTPPHARYEIPENDPAWQAVKDKPWSTNAKVHAAFNILIDRNMGELFDLLKDLGLEKETIVMFCSDNGASHRFDNSLESSGALRGNKKTMYEGGIRVPFIARWPGHIEPGSVSELPVYFPDIYPTLASLADIPVQKPTDGISFLPEMLGNKMEQEKHDYMYWELPTYNWGENQYTGSFQRAVRHNQWKLVRHADDTHWELYNLKEDPGETNNLAGTYPEIVEQMTRWMDENRDAMPPQPEPEMPEGKMYR